MCDSFFLINVSELYSIKNAIGNFAQKVKKDAIKYNKAKEVLGGPQAAGAAGSGLVGAGLFDETNDTSNNMTFDEDDLEGGRLVDKLKSAGDKIARTAQLVPLPLNAIATGVGAVKGRKARSQNQIDDTDRVFLDASEGAYTNPTQRKSLGPFNYIGGSKENALYIDPKTRKGIIAFRGSTMGKDAYDDWIRSDARGIARGRLQDEPRWKRTEKYLNAILGNYPNISFVFTGHSFSHSCCENL